MTLPEFDMAVDSGDSLILESNVTLRASAYLHHLVLRSNYVESALSGILFNLLKNDVRFIWSSELHKVDLSVVNNDFIW